VSGNSVFTLMEGKVEVKSTKRPRWIWTDSIVKLEKNWTIMRRQKE